VKTLLDIQDPKMLMSGVWPSVAKNQAVLWRDSENVVFNDGSAEKLPGYTTLGEADAPVTGLAQAYVEGQKRVYFGTAAKVGHVTDGVLSTIGTGFTGGKWVLEPWGTWLLATNNDEPPQIWKNTGSLAEWAPDTMPFARARLVKKLSNFPLVFSGQEVAWPHLLDIEDFTLGDPTKRGGKLFLRDLDSDVIAAAPLSQGLAFYTHNRMGILNFIGGTAVFGQRMLLHGVGAAGRNCIVPVGPKHYGIGLDGLWVCDGNGFIYIDQPAVNRWFTEQVDPLWLDDAFSFHIKDRSLIVWVFRCKDALTRGLTFNYSNNAWGPLRVGWTAGADQEVFAESLVADGAKIGRFDLALDAGGSAIATSLRSSPIHVGAPTRTKQWDCVRVAREGSGTVEVRFGFSDTEAAEPIWTAWSTLLRDNYINATTSPNVSVYLTIELRSSGAAVSWRLSGLTVYGEPRGEVLT
jgi:hypothetical protein